MALPEEKTGLTNETFQYESGTKIKLTAVPDGVKVGDVNGNGKINIRDYALLQKYLLTGVSEYIS